MDVSITLHDLGLIILFLICVVLGVFLFILIKNLNSAIITIKNILNSNKDNIDNTLNDLPTISKNIAEITDTTKDELKSVQNTIHSLSETADMTAAAANTIKNDFAGKVKTVFEIIDLIKKFWPKEKKTESE